MERYVIEQSWHSRDIVLEKGDTIVMLGEGGWPHTQQVNTKQCRVIVGNKFRTRIT